MLKDNVAVIGLGLGGETVGLEFQKRNYPTYLINGSAQDNKTLSGAKNLMILEGYDGLAGDRSLALNALKKNKDIIIQLGDIKQKIILCIASGGGSTGSGTIPFICDLVIRPDNIVVPVLLMPRGDEPIQKRLNAYNVAKEIMETDGIGAVIFVNNEAYQDLKKINGILVNMLDAFFSDTSSSSGSNFDDSEKMKMLQESGAFILAMLSNKNADTGKVTSNDMVNALTAKNIFLPINNDGVVGNIGVINQTGNNINEHEIVKAIGVPENIFVGHNGSVNIACASGLGMPTEYISRLGKSAVEEQKERLNKRSTVTSFLDELDMTVEPVAEKKQITGKRKRVSFDELRNL